MRAHVVQRLVAVAAQQHGALSVDQARAAGLTAKAQRAAVARGELTMLFPTVLALAGGRSSWLQKLHAGVLALRGCGWVSHRAAAQLHGLDRFVADVVEFTVERSGRRRLEGLGTVHTTERLGRLDLVSVGGLRCTSATRTILDLAYLGVPGAQLEAAIDSAIRLRLSAPVVVARRLEELRGPTQRGARRLDDLLLDSGGETVLERAFLRLMREAELPRPRTQVVQRHDDVHVARVDFLFEAERIVVEVSGQLGHSSPRERTKDAQRRNEVIDLGYRPYEYTWYDVMRRPRYVAETMRERLCATKSKG
jgi:very-short-patch-repair endonuclease